MSRLEKLSLRQTDVTDDGIKSLSNSGLVSIDISETSVTDASLLYLSRLRELKYIFANCALVTNEAPRLLSGLDLRELETYSMYVDLNGNPFYRNLFPRCNFRSKNFELAPSVNEGNEYWSSENRQDVLRKTLENYVLPGHSQ